MSVTDVSIEDNDWIKENFIWRYWRSKINFYIVNNIVTCRPIARERLGKQARNKYATNNRVDPLLGNPRNTRTQQQNRLAKGVFYVSSQISIARQRMFSVLWSDPRLYNEKTTIIDS
jgi:hypothetical protein